LPEGEVDLCLAEGDDDMSEADLARLNDALERGFEAIKAGRPARPRFCGCLSRSGNDDTLRNQAGVHRERAVAPRYPGRLSHHAANASSNGSSGYGWFEQPF